MNTKINISDKKCIDHLEYEQQIHQAKLDLQKEYQKFISQLSHDVISPLNGLEYVLEFHKTKMSEHTYEILQGIGKSLSNIAGHILVKNEEEKKKLNLASVQKILVSLALDDIILQKRYKYYNQPEIEFKLKLESPAYLAFIKGELTSFYRMISSLIDNAVEAYEGEKGSVNITLSADDKNVIIKIQDYGNEISQEMIDKILRKETLPTTLKQRPGLGLSQAIGIIDLYKGQFVVKSQKHSGTLFTIILPSIPKPKWIPDEIIIPQNSTIVVLDDDEMLHQDWKDILKPYNLKIECFSDDRKTLSFIRDFHPQEKLFFLCDFQLRKPGTDGIMVIQNSGLQNQSLVITNIYNDVYLCERIEAAKLKLFPKPFIKKIPIQVR